MNYEIVENLKNLEKSYPKLSTELLQNFDMSDWINEQLFIYDNIEEFVKYELHEGWYADRFGDTDYNGAPDPLDYISYKEFGEALKESWDNSLYFESKTGKIITTNYGWI